MKIIRPLTIVGLACLIPLATAQTTKDQQQALTPDTVIAQLKAGNARFVDAKLQPRDHAAAMVNSANHQYPKAIVLSCVDSRVPVELVFDQGIGDLFVARVAGNIADQFLIGSMEFATKLSGSKVVLVLGHTNCGAVKGAVDGAELGELTSLLTKIKDTVATVEGFDADERTTKNAEFIQKAVEANVKHTVVEIRETSEVLAALEKSGSIKIVGAIYDLETGKVRFLD